MKKNGEKHVYSKCLLRIAFLRALCYSKFLYLYGPFCYGAFKLDTIYNVCNILSWNISSILTIVAKSS